MSQVEVKFKTLCANDRDSCNRVIEIMENLDFRIDKNERGSDYDHVGIRKFDSLLDAHLTAETLTKKAGIDLLRLRIHPTS